MTPNSSLRHHFWGTRFTESHYWGSSPGHQNWKLYPIQIFPHFSIFVCLNSSHSSQLGQTGQLEMGPACCAACTVAKPRSQGMTMTASHWHQRAHRELTSDCSTAVAWNVSPILLAFHLFQPQLTLAGNIHAVINPIDLVHVQSSWFHEHCCVSLCLLPTFRVGSFIFPTQISFCFNNPAPELSAIRKFANQNLKERSECISYQPSVQNNHSKSCGNREVGKKGPDGTKPFPVSSL